MFEKILYKIVCFDLGLYKSGAREIIEIYPDGNVIIKKYSAGSRKIKDKYSFVVSEAEIDTLYKNLRMCIDYADDNVQFIDDSAAELSIIYPFGRVEKMPRGLGTGDSCVGSIVMDFIDRYSDKW